MIGKRNFFLKVGEGGLNIMFNKKTEDTGLFIQHRMIAQTFALCVFGKENVLGRV